MNKIDKKKKISLNGMSVVGGGSYIKHHKYTNSVLGYMVTRAMDKRNMESRERTIMSGQQY